MPIRHIITAETILSFEASAHEKYEAGFELLANGVYGTGVYLMGLAAEMMLKAAYFRYIGIGQTVNIDKTHLTAAKNNATSLGVIAQPEQYHNLKFWSELIIKQRISDSKSLSVGIETTLNGYIQKLNDNWEIGMRYKDYQQGVQISDLNDVFDAVTWIHDNQESLWR